MNVESLQQLSRILYAVGGGFFLLSIILFFALKIPEAFGIATRLASKIRVRKLRKEHEKSLYQANNATTGAVRKAAESAHTSKIATANLEEDTMPSFPMAATTILTEAPETSLPVEAPDVEFTVTEEMSFKGSKEIAR